MAQRVDAFLDRILREEMVHVRRARLPDAIDPAERLRLNSRFEKRLAHQHMARFRQIHTVRPRLRRQEKDLDRRSVLKLV